MSLAIILAAVLAVLWVVVVKKEMHYWIFPYITYCLSRCIYKHAPERPIDILFCVCDHFEPSYRQSNDGDPERRVSRWISEYPHLADRHRDYDGIKPRHTWFFSPHDHRKGLLESLTKLCSAGYGEIELHLHHDHIPPVPDTSETLEKKISDCVAAYAELGIFGRDNKTDRIRFGFIHGDWALDNSMGGKFCGVNNELEILERCGCYADFTFPSICRSQPRKINSIYYAIDDPARPKSYDTGVDAKAGTPPEAGLLIVEGILGLRCKKNPPFIGIEASNISRSDIPTSARVDFWVRNAVYVKGRPEWLVIKVHTHGAYDLNADVVLGDSMHLAYKYLEKKYNDGKRYRLHYVSARELYNIIKAAEHGEDGNPGKFRNYEVGIPRNCRADSL